MWDLVDMQEVPDGKVVIAAEGEERERIRPGSGALSRKSFVPAPCVSPGLGFCTH